VSVIESAVRLVNGSRSGKVQRTIYTSASCRRIDRNSLCLLSVVSPVDSNTRFGVVTLSIRFFLMSISAARFLSGGLLLAAISVFSVITVYGDNVGCDEQSRTATSDPDSCSAAVVECTKTAGATHTLSFTLTVSAEGSLVFAAGSGEAGVTVTISWTDHHCATQSSMKTACAPKVSKKFGSASGAVTKLRAHDCFLVGGKSRQHCKCREDDITRQYTIGRAQLDAVKALFSGWTIPADAITIPYTVHDCVRASTCVQIPCAGEYKTIDATCFQ